MYRARYYLAVGLEVWSAFPHCFPFLCVGPKQTIPWLTAQMVLLEWIEYTVTSPCLRSSSQAIKFFPSWLMLCLVRTVFKPSFEISSPSWAIWEPSYSYPLTLLWYSQGGRAIMACVMYVGQWLIDTVSHWRTGALLGFDIRWAINLSVSQFSYLLHRGKYSYKFPRLRR